MPVRGHGGPQGCEILKLPHFLDNSLIDGASGFGWSRWLPDMEGGCKYIK
jgi:hypothetical protein